MSDRWGTRTAVCAAVTIAVLALSGCSGSGDGDAAKNQAGGRAATTGPAPLPEPSGLTPGYEGSAPTSTVRVLPDISTRTASSYVIAAGTTATKKRFQPLMDTLGGVKAEVTFYRASRSSKPAADIAVFTFAPAQARSQMFQGQIVSQLVASAAGGKKVAYDTINGRTFTVAGKDTKAVGAFDGNSAVIVLGATGSKSLDLATGATFAYLKR